MSKSSENPHLYYFAARGIKLDKCAVVDSVKIKRVDRYPNANAAALTQLPLRLCDHPAGHNMHSDEEVPKEIFLESDSRDPLLFPDSCLVPHYCFPFPLIPALSPSYLPPPLPNIPLLIHRLPPNTNQNLAYRHRVFTLSAASHHQRSFKRIMKISLHRNCT